MEHFITLFDSNFLPQGMSLHESLSRYVKDFHLWVVCMDEKVQVQLEILQLPHLTTISLTEVEDESLLSVKSGRTRAEYCWTITPFTPGLVFSRDLSAERVTYLDADLLFFASPDILFQEFKQSCKHVMITEHAYAPEYLKYMETSGRFCVQFMVFDRSARAERILAWWKARCIEWCFARLEDGKFGDQKYLDVWPQIFSEEVHILRQVENTLAPWNVDHLLKQKPFDFRPVLFHFHALRIIADDCIKLFDGYKVTQSSMYLYEEYLDILRSQIMRLRRHGIQMPVLAEQAGWRSQVRSWINSARGLSSRVKI